MSPWLQIRSFQAYVCEVVTKFICIHSYAVYMEEAQLRKLIIQAIMHHHEGMAQRYRRIFEGVENE